jgi:hypothetical protein
MISGICGKSMTNIPKTKEDTTSNWALAAVPQREVLEALGGICIPLHDAGPTDCN